MYLPAASMGEYDSYKAPNTSRKKPPGGLEREDSRQGLSRAGSRTQLTRAASQTYLRNYSPLPQVL